MVTESHRRSGVVTIEDSQPTPRTEHAVRLCERAFRFGDVAQRRVEDDEIELASVEREGAAVTLPKLNPRRLRGEFSGASDQSR